jgi:hypothetical protein
MLGDLAQHGLQVIRHLLIPETQDPHPAHALDLAMAQTI